MNPTTISATHSLMTLIPILLSAAAILISLSTALFTAYLQYFRKPNVSLYISKWVRCWMGANGELVANIGLTATNSGAQYAVITKITGTITHEDSNSIADIQWSKFVKYENAGTLGESFKPHGSFAGWSDYLVVPNRQAVGNTVQFNSLNPCSIKTGRYMLRLTAYSGSGTKSSVAATVQVNFDVSDQKAIQLGRTKADSETKVSNGSVNLGIY